MEVKRGRGCRFRAEGLRRNHVSEEAEVVGGRSGSAAQEAGSPKGNGEVHRRG